jgi:hypothetical protein
MQKGEAGVEELKARWKRGPEEVGDDVNKSDDGNETTSVDKLAGHGGRLADGNTRPGDWAKLGDRGDDGGDKDEFSDGENLIGTSEFEDCMNRLGACADGSGDRVRVGSGNADKFEDGVALGDTRNDDDESGEDNGDGTAGVEGLVEHDNGLAHRDPRSGDSAKLGDRVVDGGDEDEFEDRRSGVGDRAELGRFDRRLAATDGVPVGFIDELRGWCKLGSFGEGRRPDEESEKCEKAQPGASNEFRESGDIEREEDTKGFVGT